MCAASWGRCSRGPGYVRRGFRSSRFLVSGGWGSGGSACSFVSVSVIALRLILVSFLRETVGGFFFSSGWASVPV